MTIHPAAATPPPISPTHRLQVKLFAGLAAAANTRLLELPWHGGTAAEVKRAVAAVVPTAEALIASSGVAIGNRYVAADTIIPPESDVALIPPVSGG
jgi:molybdopterin converting factor small subunit